LGILGAMFSAMLAAFWAYEGWNTITFMGGEIKNPHRSIPLSLIGGVGFVILTYLVVNAAYLYVMPVGEMAALPEGKIAGVEVIRKFLGEGSVMMLSILVLLATFNSTNTVVMGAPRIYYAMAKDKVFFKPIGNVHPIFRTPGNALLLQGVWACLLVLSGTFDQLTDMLIFAAFIFYGAGAFGVFVLRKTMRDAKRPYKVWGYPVLPGIFVLFCAALVFVSIIEKPREAAIGLILILAGVPLYLFFRKRGD
jgi:basic amino acid/polyamine antiporter, APA family